MPNRYVILESSQDARPIKEPSGPELIKLISESGSVEYVQQFTIHDLKTVRQAATKRLTELINPNQE